MHISIKGDTALRDPKTKGSTIIMREIEVDNTDLYNTYARTINNRLLVILHEAVPEPYEPIILAVEDCDEDEKEALAYRFAKEVSKPDRPYIPHKISAHCYILRRKNKLK